MLDDTRTEPYYYKQNNESELQGYLIAGAELSGRYRIEGILGHGGFGITYKAWDRTFEKYVAIKEYYPASIVNRGVDGKTVSVMTQNDRKEFEDGVERFLREARDVSKFSVNNNIVTIFDFFKENNTAYMVMEFLDGQTLKEYLERQNTIDENLQLHIAFSVLEVLETIHSKGVIHRDISPDNIFICNDLTIKLIDFGAAKDDTQNDVKTVSVVLKKGYAPIEQYSAKSIISPRIDIYAFGATMYYLLTRVVPVPSVDRVINDDLIEPKKLNPNISDEWNKVILKCMEIKAEDRYSSVEEIRQDLLRKDEPNKTSINNQGINYQQKQAVTNYDNIGPNYNYTKQPSKDKKGLIIGICAFISLFVIAAVILVIVKPFGNKEHSNGNTDVNYEKVRMIDNAGLLTESQRKTLEEKLDNLSAKYNCDIIIITENSIGDKDPNEYANYIFTFYGFGLGKSNSGISLLINMEYRDWAVTAHSNSKDSGAQKIFTYNKTDAIGLAILNDLSSGDYYGAFDTFINNVESHLKNSETISLNIYKTVSESV